MSKEKQIEEMAKALCPMSLTEYCASGICTNPNCLVNAKALETLYNAGYRKQSEGEWEKVMNHRECSNCHYRAPYKKIKAGYHLQDLTAYCPNCGVKMGGGEE